MLRRQAKILQEKQLQALRTYARHTRWPVRNDVIVLLSAKAGLRAGEIADLSWSMVLNASGEIGPTIELNNCAAKKGGGRRIPLHAELKSALQRLRRNHGCIGTVIRSERGGPMRASSIVQWFATAFSALGYDGCSSHSGRRTFITRAARVVERAGGSLRDVQLLAGHRSIETTQRYIEGDTSAQRRIVELI